MKPPVTRITMQRYLSHEVRAPAVAGAQPELPATHACKRREVTWKLRKARWSAGASLRLNKKRGIGPRCERFDSRILLLSMRASTTSLERQRALSTAVAADLSASGAFSVARKPVAAPTPSGPDPR